MKTLDHISPSMMSTFDDCLRKGWFTYVLGLRAPPHPSATLGSAIHKQLENFVEKGINPNRLERAGAIALTGLHLLPPILSRDANGVATTANGRLYSELNMEGHPANKLTLGGLKVTGRIDLTHLYTDWLSGAAQSRIEIDDWKSTSNILYTKDEDELRKDNQALIYGKFALDLAEYLGQPRPEWVRFAHFVLLTQGPAIPAIPTRIDLPARYLAQQWDRLENKVERMKAAAAKEKPADVEPTLSSCNKYRGCYFRDRCKALGAFGRPLHIFDHHSTVPRPDVQVTSHLPGEKRMNAMDILRAKKKATESGSSNTPTTSSTVTTNPVVTSTPAPAAESPLLARLRAKAAAEPRPAEGIVPPDAGRDEDEPAVTPALAPEAAPTAASLEAARLLVEAAAAASAATAALGTPNLANTADITAENRARPEALAAEAARLEALAPDLAALTAARAEIDAAAKVRRPKGFAEKLPALGYDKASIDSMSATEMRRIIDGGIQAGTQRAANPLDVAEAAPVVAEIEEMGELAASGDVKLDDIATAIIERLAGLPPSVQLAIAKGLAEHTGTPVAEDEAPELTLYVDCAPLRGEPCVHLEDILKPFMDRACTETGEAHYGLIGGGYGKGADYVAAQLEEAHKAKPYRGSIVCWTMFPATKKALEFLYPVAHRIVSAR